VKEDLYPHGSRELVMDSLVANNAADADSLAADAAAVEEAPAAEAAPEEAPAARTLLRSLVVETVPKHSDLTVDSI